MTHGLNEHVPRLGQCLLPSTSSDVFRLDSVNGEACSPRLWSVTLITARNDVREKLDILHKYMLLLLHVTSPLLALVSPGGFVLSQPCPK